MEPEPTDTRIALGIAQERNRDLLTTLLAEYAIVDLAESVPEGTDLCIIDEAGYDHFHDALTAWRTQQHPTYAPVLLLTKADSKDPWDEYAGALETHIDAIQPIPVSQAALTARVRNLLGTRQYSRELATQKQLTERIFDTSPLAKVVLNTDGDIIRANDRATAVLGLDKPTLTDRTYNSPEWTIIDEHGELVPDADLPFAQVMATGEPVYGFEHGIDRPDGEGVWLSVNMAPLRDETGAIEYVVGAIEDITERRAQERELERQVDIFEKAQDIADVGAWEYDLTTGEAWWSEKVSRIHGLPDDTPPSPELSLEYFHQEDRPVIRTAFERAIEDGEPYDLELRLIDADGNQRWVKTRGEPQYSDGDLRRIRGTIQDITERKEREIELRQMTRAVNEAPIGVTITDPSQEDNPIIYVNEGFVSLTGYAREEAVGRNCRFLQGDNTDKGTVADIREAVAAEEAVSVVLRNYRADGTEFWNSLEIAPVRDVDGDVINFIGFQQDVTDRMEQQRQLDIIDRYLRHNLRNEMTIVRGLAELIQEEARPQTETFAEEIVDHSTRLIETAEKERKLMKLLGEEPTLKAIDVVAVIRELLGALGAEYPEATLSVEGPEEAVVRATPELRVALEELMRNALDHNPSDSRRLEVIVTRDGDEVSVEIADNGPGIPELEVDILSGKTEETAVYHGQGIGLWLVYLVIRRCEGRVEFASNDTTGSVVTVHLIPD